MGKNDQPEGFGTLRYDYNGDTKIAMFQKGQIHGDCYIVNRNGDAYFETYASGKPQGDHRLVSRAEKEKFQGNITSMDTGNPSCELNYSKNSAPTKYVLDDYNNPG